MKKNIFFLGIILITIISLILACSPEKTDFSFMDDRKPEEGGDGFNINNEERQQRTEGMPGPRMNISEEERQQMFEEQQQKSIEACESKNEDDLCKIESPRGDITGNCKIMDEKLVCMTERPMIPR
ncbi:hypothetical protein JXB41_02045 [Candidatus Woesearchaeota archaeon]|nr:hypothetical protein [Candidatus Woesearchaeota archaeon]